MAKKKGGKIEDYKNLQNLATLDPERALEIRRMAANKTNELLKQRKSMKETLNILLSLPMKKGKVAEPEQIKSFAALKGKNITIETAILIAQTQKALKGDLESAKFVRDTSGQKPKDELNIDGNIPVVISGDDELED